MVNYAFYRKGLNSGCVAAAMTLVLACGAPGSNARAQGPEKMPPTQGEEKALTNKPTKPAAKAGVAKKIAPAKAAKAKAPSPPVKEKVQPVTVGLRDPFKKPLPPKAGPEGAPELRPPGSRGLLISELILEGVVREDTKKTMIAVVAGPERRAYFLRVNDPVYHGSVSKITNDSVFFQETYTDAAGHEATRELVKKLPGSGEKP